MEARDFIIRELKSMHQQLPATKIRYEHDVHANYHIIEVLPIDAYQNEQFMYLECGFEKVFEARFPKEEILFISSDSLSKIKKATFKLGYEEQLTQKVSRVACNTYETNGDLTSVSTAYDFVSAA